MSEYIWPITVLLIFSGMLSIVWKALTISHDLAKIVLQGGYAVPKPQAVVPGLATPTLPAPVVHPVKTVVPEGTVVDEGLVAFIKKQEAYSAKAYWDYKQYSIGYGTKANSPTEVIDEAEATRRMVVEVTAAEKIVEKVAANAPKGVKQALTDLTYNAGAGWENGTLGKLILEGKYEEAKAVVLQYNHAGGHVNAGLTARREAEVKWFDNPI